MATKFSCHSLCDGIVLHVFSCADNHDTDVRNISRLECVCVHMYRSKDKISIGYCRCKCGSCPRQHGISISNNTKILTKAHLTNKIGTGYRQLTRWCWGLLGKEFRVVLPSCAMCCIRVQFPPPGLEEDFMFEGFHFPDE